MPQLERLEDRTAPAIVNLLPHPSSGELNGAIFTHLHGLPGTGGEKFLSIREQPIVTGIEQGYNTNAALEFDTKEPTRGILLSEVPTVNVGGTTYREFILDINESSNQGHEFLALNDLRVYIAGVNNLSGYDAGTGQLGGQSPLYDLDAGEDSTILLDGSGSGALDMFFLVPDSLFVAADPSATFVYLYSRFGDTTGITPDILPPGTNPAWFNADDGFEHWSISTGNPRYPRADLAVTKTDFQTTAIPGQVVNYTITVTNNGPTPVTSFTFTDVVPPELLNPVFLNPSAGSLNLTQTGNTSSGIWGGVNLAAGQSVSITLRGTVDPAATGSMTNTVSVFTTPGTADPNLTNNTASDTDILTPQADLAITKTDVNDLLHPGDAVDYTITIENLGPSNVVGAQVTDVFPPEITSHDWLVTSATPGAFATPSSGGVAADIATSVDIPAGGVIVITVHRVIDPNLDPPPGGQVVSNTARVDSPIDPNPNNNESTHTDLIVSEDVHVDLMVEKSHLPQIGTPGESVTYTITVRNHGEVDAIGATIQDAFFGTPGFSAFDSMTWVVSASSGAANITPLSASGPLSASFDLVVGGFITFTVTGDIDPAALGTIVNTVEVFPPPGTTDPDADNVATDQVPLVPVVNVTVDKDDGVTTVVPGTNITYTIVIANSGPSDAPGVLVTDSFPAELTAITWTSTAAGGATGNDLSGSGNIFDFIDLPAGGSVTYIVQARVVSTATGILVNTATATVPQDGTVEDTDTDELTPVADLAVTKRSIPIVVKAGSVLTYRIIITNRGPSAVSDFTLTDVFPVAFMPLSFRPSLGTYDPNTGLWSGVVLGPGQRVVLTVRGRVANPAPPVLLNTATVMPPEGVTDPDLTNNDTRLRVPVQFITPMPSKRWLLASFWR